MNDRKVEYVCVVFILIAASLLMLMNLGNRFLWQDEAQTACISKTVLQYGVPHGFDGKNYFSQEGGAEYGPSFIWRWHTWLPFYVLAGFFRLFGESTLVARLPFALFGIATVLMCYYLGRRLWKTRRAGVLTAVLLLLSVPFLILTRQCRYYSMTAFFTIAGLYTYLGILEGRKRSTFWFALNSLLLFHTHYLYYAALAATTVVHMLIFHRSKWIPVLCSSAVVFVLNLPVIIWLSGANFAGSISYVVKAKMYHGDKVKQFLIMTGVYLKLIKENVFSPSLLVVPAVGVIAAAVKKRAWPTPQGDMGSRVWLMIILIVVTLIACAQLAPHPYFRYLVTLLPVFCLLTAYFTDHLMRLHWLPGILLLAILAFTGSTRDFLYEITHDWNGPVEGIVRYLRANSSPDDVVVCYHEEMPLKFYLPNKVYGGLTGEPLAGAEHAKWIVFRLPTQAAEERTRSYMRADEESGKYKYIRLDGYPNLQFENREEPAEHGFRTPIVAKENYVWIMKRVAN